MWGYPHLDLVTATALILSIGASWPRVGAGRGKVHREVKHRPQHQGDRRQGVRNSDERPDGGSDQLRPRDSNGHG